MRRGPAKLAPGGRKGGIKKMGDASWEKAEVCFRVSSITFGKLVELFFFWIVLGFRNSNRFMKQYMIFTLVTDNL